MKRIITKANTSRILYTKEEITEMLDFRAITTNDIKRLEKAYNHYVINLFNGNDGALGTLQEALKRRPRSNKWNGARSGQETAPQADITAKIDGKLIAVESKTNGGRIDDIKDKYIVYSININNSTGKCYIAPRIMRTETFLNALACFNAVKVINKKGEFSGYGIQCSKRGLWKWLEQMPLYEREREYLSSEIF